jgi:hypothetical protein
MVALLGEAACRRYGAMEVLDGAMANSVHFESSISSYNEGPESRWLAALA